MENVVIDNEQAKMESTAADSGYDEWLSSLENMERERKGSTMCFDELRYLQAPF